MRCIGYCFWFALMTGLSACKAQQSKNEAQASANSTQQAAGSAKDKQSAAKAPAAKCPNLTTQLPVDTPDLTRKVFACVERNALLYSKGPDSAEALSRAVMAKCKETIVQYVDSEAKRAGIKPPYKEAFQSWQDHTLPIIAEARARRCYG